MSLRLLLLCLLVGGSQGQDRRYLLQVKRTVKVQEGLCIVVPCSFSSPERHWVGTLPAYGYWFKGSKKPVSTILVATNNKDKITQSDAQGRFQLLGVISERNCSLMIKDVQWKDSASYFFRVERGREKFSFQDGFFLQVEALTHKPDVFIPEILDPGQPVTVVCLFYWTFEQCPAPSFSWMGAAVSPQETRSHSYYSVLSFTPELRHHDTELTCQVTFSRRSMQRTVRLRMAYAPRDLAISIFRDNVSEPHGATSHLEVQQGQSLRLLCAADSQPPATLSWGLEHRVLSWSSPMGSRTLGLELPLVKAADSGRYTCQAENRLGFQQHTLELSVLCECDPPNVPSSGEERDVMGVRAHEAYNSQTTGWVRSSCWGPVSESPPTASISGKDALPREKALARLEPFPVFLADPPEDLRVTVSHANRTVLEILRNGTSLPVLEGQSLCLVCATHSNPPASLSWTGVAQTLLPSQSPEPGVLELPLVRREHEGEFTCAAQNPLGVRSISLSLSVTYPPQMPRPSCSPEAEGLHCSCSSRAWPAPALRWRLGEGLLEGNSSNVSFAVTSSSTGPWANSSLSLHGELWPGLWLSCEAWNTHGARRASVLLRPEKDSSTAFSKGAALGFGIMALFTLCLMITVKTLQKKGTPKETAKISRGSTILDYINVVPRTRSLVQNWKTKPDTPSRIPPLNTHSPKAKKKQKEPHFTSPGCPNPKSSSQMPVSENNPEELHYASLNFSRLRLWETQNPQDSFPDYAEVRFH